VQQFGVKFYIQNVITFVAQYARNIEIVLRGTKLVLKIKK
jgi:hypothetical protein